MTVSISCLSSAESSHVNPWLRNWRTLGTELACHVQDLLSPLPLAAFPTSLKLETREDEQARHPDSSQERAGLPDQADQPVRLSRLITGKLATRAAHLTPEERSEEQESIALLGLRLTPCQWRILHLLLAHPLLSDQELALLLALQRTSVRSSLYTLHRLGCLESSRSEAGTRWYVGERGLRLIAAANHLSVRNLAVVTDDEAGAGTSIMMQRGVDWLLRHIQHTAGLYRFFATLTEAARQEPGHALCWWETGAMCERRYRVGEQWYNLRPDALAEYRVGTEEQQQRFRFWLEWDRGTMNARDLAVKFTAYAYYLDSREWAREGARSPWLLCVAPDIAQERRVQRVAQARLAPLPGMEVWTTTEGLLNQHGPHASIWSWRILARGRQGAQLNGSLRQSVFALPPEKGIN